MSVNTLAELASHKNQRVRLWCCNMLKTFLVYLPDRYDHQTRLLPYVLSFINDDMSSTIQDEALECLERCGLQYEREHPDEVIERRQFGVDGEDTIDYNSNLPAPFTHRPSLGARLFVRANCSRFFLAVLDELSNWREQTRKRSADLLLILTIYCEEHLTKDFQHTIKSVAKAIGIEKSSTSSNESNNADHLRILEKIQQVLRLMAKYVDPTIYLPFLCLRIGGGDNASATSNSEDGAHSEQARTNHTIILSSLIEGAPLHRLMPHWLDLVSLFTGADCIGSFVGTQRRYESLMALSTLIGRVVVSSKEKEEDMRRYFLSYFIVDDTNDMTNLQSTLASSMQALTDMVPPLPPNNSDSDVVGKKYAKVAKECIASLQTLLLACQKALPDTVADS